MPESRLYNAEYYDAFEADTDDIEFYKKFVNETTSVLELGCGTGRVSRPLAKSCKSLVGVDVANVMLERAKEHRSAPNIEYIHDDITSLDLKKNFDLLIAPFRVMQALETIDEVKSFLEVLKRHMNSDSLAIVNVFNPKFSKKEMKEKWISHEEAHWGEKTLSSGDIVKFSDVRPRIDIENQVMYPELIYRRYRGGELIDTHVNPVCMKYWYADEFRTLLVENGFLISETWGGYSGEKYGEGPELVVGLKLG